MKVTDQGSDKYHIEIIKIARDIFQSHLKNGGGSRVSLKTPIFRKNYENDYTDKLEEVSFYFK